MCIHDRASPAGVPCTLPSAQPLTTASTVERETLRAPWAHRAEYELNQGFGWTWTSGFRDPRYDNATGIKVPVL